MTNTSLDDFTYPPNPFDKVPDDLLVIMLAEVVDAERDHYLSLEFTRGRGWPYRYIAFTHVCHRWRVVALEYPLLWNDIVVTDRREILRVLLERSKESPLYIRAHTPYPSCRKTDLLASPDRIQITLQDIIQPENLRSRIRKLDLKVRPDDFPHILRELDGSLEKIGTPTLWSSLQTLCLEIIPKRRTPHATLPLHVLAHMPKLMRLELGMCALVHTTPPMSPHVRLKELIMFSDGAFREYKKADASVLDAFGESLESLQLYRVSLALPAWVPPVQDDQGQEAYDLACSLPPPPFIDLDTPPYDPGRKVLLPRLRSLDVKDRLRRVIPVLGTLRLPMTCRLSLEVDFLGDLDEDWVQLGEFARQIKQKLHANDVADDQDPHHLQSLLIGVGRNHVDPFVYLSTSTELRVRLDVTLLMGDADTNGEDTLLRPIESFASIVCAAMPFQHLMSLTLRLDCLGKDAIAAPKELASALVNAGAAERLRWLKVARAKVEYVCEFMTCTRAIFPAPRHIVLKKIDFSNARSSRRAQELHRVLTHAAPFLERLRLTKCKGLATDVVAPLFDTARTLVIEPPCSC
ncbi:hypothetical protein EIP91_009364 [Steccherinum ochraceum]|uniref:F-box domain-containing protein n=1 Tax=Steccherinum ochraceum TaxID=92696 RepID=A0A4V2MV29_9APHY|nr:hypothetical protein EIP91_009364 [Steccherinum ochraceum]